MVGLASDVLAARAHLGEHDVETLLVDEAQARAGETHLHPAVLALDPEAAILQVRQVAALGLVVGVGHVVSDSGGLPRHLAYAGHEILESGCRIKALDFSTNPLRGATRARVATHGGGAADGHDGDDIAAVHMRPRSANERQAPGATMKWSSTLMSTN